jgi:hypothetical protein
MSCAAVLSAGGQVLTPGGLPFAGFAKGGSVLLAQYFEELQAVRLAGHLVACIPRAIY